MNDADPLAERNTRAHQYLQEGRDDLAIPLFEEVLAERMRVLGADHPDTIASRNILAGAYESAWCLGKAISQYKKVLAQPERGNYMTLEASAERLHFSCFLPDGSLVDEVSLRK